jgi:hypothetical protein
MHHNGCGAAYDQQRGVAGAAFISACIGMTSTTEVSSTTHSPDSDHKMTVNTDRETGADTM